jgi:putative DNA methylase
MAELKLNSEQTARSGIRDYERPEAVVFLRTKEAFGGLSNMAAGFPLQINGVRIATSEALYQACRFPHLPEVQRLIIEQNSPMTAKMKSKPYRSDSRPDWDRVRVKIMRWCLRVKLAQNYASFARLLLSTGERPIVEESRKDDFWGAKPREGERLIGMNVLGRLLMELREEVRNQDQRKLTEVLPLNISDFLLFSQPIEAIRSSSLPEVQTVPMRPPTSPSQPLRSMPFEAPRDKMTTIRKKLIEVSIPLEAINAASAREKQIKTGKPLQVHHWWSRKPLVTCRAVLFAQLVDDPSSWPERFDHDVEKIDAERRRLHKVIEAMVPWEASNDEAILSAARWEIARSVAWGLGEEPPRKDDGKAILQYLQTKAPPVYDPFSGGGSIPLEAQRLGLRAYGSDLNPVAVLIGKALVEIPSKFAGNLPVNPKARAQLKHGRWNGQGAQGLAEDVRYYGQWMRDEAEKQIGQLYPKATLADGSKATVVAWLWARTVRSPDPAVKGAMVPLVSSFLLSTREGKKAWVEPVIDPSAPDGYRFEVQIGRLSKLDEERLKKGTMTGRGNFSCLLTGSVISEEWNRSEGKAKRLGSRLMAIVADGARNRIYLSPTNEHEATAKRANPAWEPDGELYATGLGFRVPAYGLTRWSDLFSPRQLVALTTLSSLIKLARERVLADAFEAGLPIDDRRLHSNGCGAAAYADAVSTYLALALDRVADWNNNLSRWENKVEVPQQLFGRQAIPMSWGFAEANPLGSATGSLVATLENINRAFSSLSRIPPGVGLIAFNDAAKDCKIIHELSVISTDPPYYDNIGYADLSDFFYVWLRNSLANIWPELFRRLITPKAEELVATPSRHGGREKAEKFFMAGMSNALAAMHRASTNSAPLTIYYAFKQSELADEGITSSGWSSFLQAAVDSALTVDGTWPMRTELANRMRGQGSNALASSVVLVCRKRSDDAAIITRADFVRALKREMPAAIDDIRKAGVGPVDMQQSVIGPGMGVFSRYAKVLEDDDSTMPVKTALSLINRVWEEIENELDANFDAETQVALAWFATYGFDARQSGELITLANAKNIPSNALFASGVFKDMKGKAALKPREELLGDWTLASDNGRTVWECVQRTARVLNAEDGGGEAAARVVAEMGPKAADARALAYRLYEIASQKGWAAEALIYNELAQEWPKLEDLASTAGARSATADAQGSLL